MAKEAFSCETCKTQECYRRQGAGFPAFCPTAAADARLVEDVKGKMKSKRKLSKIALVSAEVEGRFYGKLTRVEETVEFLKRAGAKKVGIATCVGLINETRLLCKIFDKRGVDYYAVCCKVGSVDKSEIGVPDENKLNRGCGFEAMCNPVLQAELCNRAGVDYNVVMGLCVGHDMLFSMHAKAPVTTLVVKDRVLAHNPVGALYTSETIYSRFKE
jgi:uncharacterized metal-binding protein